MAEMAKMGEMLGITAESAADYRRILRHRPE
jgi:hypothetical protein